MMRTLCVVLCLVSSPAFAQNAPAVDDLLQRIEQLGVEAGKLKNPPPPAPPPSAPVITVAPGGSIQDAVNKATVPGTTIQLTAGGLYRESVIVPKPNVGLILTTEGCALGDRAALPSDLPRMATIQGTVSYGIWVMASRTKVRCLSFGWNGSAGAGEMVRVGDATSAVLENVPDGVEVTQNYFHGNPGVDFGQKRAIGANGSNLLIDQNYAENIWAPQQDSQCVAVFSTPGPITIRRNLFVGCGSENIMLGGTPPAGPAFVPSDILVERNVLAKPVAWRTLSNHQVKNLFEVKNARRVMARHNWLENNWQGSQPGYAVLLTMATNGACSYCVMEDISFIENVVTNVAAGLNLTGYQYSYAPGAGAGVRYTIKGNLFVITKATMGGNGRFVFMQNEPKDVVIDHNTVIQDGSAIAWGDYGTKWPYQEPPLTGSIPAGPLKGFQFTNNLITPHGAYGILTPEGNSGVNLATYFPGAVVGGNVLAGAPDAALARYNAFAGAAGPNVGLATAAFQALFKDYAAGDYCLAQPGNAGADCAALPFDLRAFVPR